MDNSEEIRKVARAEAEAVISEYQMKCITEGPICGVWEEIGKMRKDLGDVKDVLAEQRGRGKNAAWLITVLGVLLTAGSVAAAVLSAARRDETVQELRALRAELRTNTGTGGFKTP